VRWAALALALVGCADNAILELTLEIPDAEAAGAPDADRVTLQFVTDPIPPGGPVPVVADDGRVATFSLPDDGIATERVSVVAPPGQVERPLFVTVVYCADRDPCPIDPGATVSVVRYERPFYRGEVTSHTLALPPQAAPDRVEVAKCDVSGCIGGTADPCDLATPPVHACEVD